MTETVVAVPMSNITIGVGYVSNAVTAFTIKSFPNWSGLSMVMDKSVLDLITYHNRFFSMSSATADKMVC